MQAERSRLPHTALLALSIIIVGYLTYRDMLGYFFTAQDSPTLIDTARIHSFNDVLRIFNEPLMNGTTLTELSLFYRPIATLSYSLDYSIWGLNPFGYHLTDLILHVLVSLLVFVLLLRLAGKPPAAWLGAIIFTTHPILVESVPAVARRHDVIAALFVLASLLFYVKHRSGPRRPPVYALASILSYLLALGAKEIAIILPALIVSYLVIFSPHQQSLLARAGAALKSAVPFLVVTVLFLGSGYFEWRIVQTGESVGKTPWLIFALMYMPAVASIVARLTFRDGFGDVSFRFGGRTGRRAMALAWAYPIAVGSLAYGTAWATGLAKF